MYLLGNLPYRWRQIVFLIYIYEHLVLYVNSADIYENCYCLCIINKFVACINYRIIYEACPESKSTEALTARAIFFYTLATLPCSLIPPLCNETGSPMRQYVLVKMSIQSPTNCEIHASSIISFGREKLQLRFIMR